MEILLLGDGRADPAEDADSRVHHGLGRHPHRSVIGLLEQILGHRDRLPAGAQIVEERGIATDLGLRARGLGRQAGEILGRGHPPAQILIGEVGAAGDGIGRLPLLEQAGHHFEDALVQLLKEAVRGQDVGHLRPGVVVQEQGAEHGLLHLDVARHLPIVGKAQFFPGSATELPCHHAAPEERVCSWPVPLRLLLVRNCRRISAGR